MILSIILIVLINLLMINVWIWMIRSHFDHVDSKKFFVISLVTGLASVTILKGVHRVIDWINLTTIRNNVRANTTLQVIVFVVLIHCLISVLFVALSDRGFGHLQVILLTRGAICILGMSGLTAIGFASTAMYYLFVALSEEYIKSCGAYTRFSKYKLTSSDVIIFGLIASLGFACVENIIHLTSQITQILTQHILSSSGLIITKGIASTMMHLFFTSFFAMAYLQYNTNNPHTFKIIIGGILGAVLTHRSYDLMLSQGYRWILILYIVLGYFWLTYILYRSDRLYIDPDKLKTISKTS